MAGAAVLAVLFGTGCDWHQGRPEDVAACAGRCLAVGCEFDDLGIRTWDTKPARAYACRCKRAFAMPLQPIPIEYISEAERRCRAKCGEDEANYFVNSGDCRCGHASADVMVRALGGSADAGAAR